MFCGSEFKIIFVIEWSRVSYKNNSSTLLIRRFFTFHCQLKGFIYREIRPLGALVVAGGGMLMPTAVRPFLLHQSKNYIGWGGGYKAARGLISRCLRNIDYCLIDILSRYLFTFTMIMIFMLYKD